MKQFILIALTLMLFGCSEEPKQVYETEIKTYMISTMYSQDHFRSPTTFHIYFQTPMSTECAEVTKETYDKYQVGQSIQVLIKYWEKPKKK